MHVSLWVDFPLSFLLLGLVYFFLPFFNLEGVWGGGGGRQEAAEKSGVQRDVSSNRWRKEREREK